ncbi:Concanavalin A-like lectin/glucanase, subgroup [Cynara cardunculus var. scolymus]|uniref:Concanavalin A-like lectin/glucanase, subgroup n=1 Tax=Cynara cardunculus var. scolymus TaxID=59895 RepID=A0A118K3G0_CYNCS|nr:Concanavalin A-like lectin/glucanase, subgroup [Cynara cardunculus var. scolymus]
MGANAAGEQLDETIVLVNLVPLKQNFDPANAFSIYQKFWKKQVFINTSRFGAYEVVYVRYPGLPPSPPAVPLNSGVTIDQSDSVNDQKGRPFKPIGVDIPRNGREKNDRPNGSMIAVVILSAVTAFVVIIGAVWLFLLKCGCCSSDSQTEKEPRERAGESLIVGSRKSSDMMSFSSSLMAYTGTAKIYSLSEIEKATDNFNSSRILGEGGFGVVYSGVLEDERKVAVKVLKRDDRQGSREFLAEVEMLSRLHHRNLVKFYGVVLLELLTGRKPVDLLQPPGQENLVSWARPQLTNREALESIIDHEIISSNTPFDSILKVAAIASMCVQPEVSHRPFMGEVVQALKLVCNEFDEIKETTSRSFSNEEEVGFKTMDHEMSGYDSKIELSATDLRSTIENMEGLESESFRRQFNSAPLKMGRKKQFWRRLRSLSRGSTSEHGFSSNL